MPISSKHLAQQSRYISSYTARWHSHNRLACRRWTRSAQHSGSIEMLPIPDDELRRWLVEDVPYGDLTTHALGFGDRPGRIRFEARQAMVAACSEEAGRIMAMAGADVT